MCSNENSERTIKSHQHHQFRVTNSSEKLLSNNRTNLSPSSGCNKNLFQSVPSQCPKSPSETSPRTSATALTIATTATTASTAATGTIIGVGSPQLQSSTPNIRPVIAAAQMSSMLGNSVVPPGLLPPLDHYRLQLYNYAMVERLRCSQYPGPLPLCPPGYPGAAVNSPYGPRFALSMSLFHNRVFQPEEPKPQHSYIGLIAMAILSSPESKLVLSDIYQHILDNYPYFRTRGPGWRNSIRHNLSLNDCFIKAGRSANGKGHYWAIHPANLEDFKKGDFRRRKAQRKVRKHMGLAVDDEGTDSPSPPPLSVTPPPHTQNVVGPTFCPTSWVAAAAAASGRPTTAGVMANIYSQSRKRQFDVASLLAPDDNENSNEQRFGSIISSRHTQQNHHHQHHQHHNHQQQQNHHLQTAQHFDTEQFMKGPMSKKTAISNSDIDEDIDVVASDDTDDNTARNLDSSLNLGQIIDHHHDDDEILNLERDIQQHPHQQQQHHHHNQQQHHHHSSILQHPQDQGFHQHQQDQDHTPTLSPTSQQDDDLQMNSSSTAASPSPNGGGGGGAGPGSGPWQGLIQQWPSNFVGAAMDPRILGRYYGQYMAAAAAQQAAVARHSAAAVVGNFLNGNSPRNGAAPPGAPGVSGDPNNGDSSDSQHQQPNHQNKIQSEINPPGNEC